MSDLLKESYPFAGDVLPSGWVEAAVGAVAAEIRTGFSSGKHNMDGIGIPHLRPMSVTPDGKVTLANARYVAPKSGDLRLSDGDVLFTNTSSTVWVGKTGVVRKPGDWAFSNHMTRLRLHDGMVPEFFAKQIHFLCRSGYFARHCTEHVNQSSIAPSLLRDKIPVRVPPLQEQQRIVARLEELQTQRDVARAHLSGIPAQLAETRLSLIAAAFSGELTREWRDEKTGKQTGQEIIETCRSERRAFWEHQQQANLREKGRSPKTEDWKKRYKPAEPFNDRLDVRLPKSWAWAAAEELTKPGRPILYGIIKPGPHDPSGVPYVRVVEMKTGKIDVANLPRASRHRAALFSRATLKAGDILISKDGTIGRVALVPPELEGGNITQHVLRLSPSVHMVGAFIAKMIESPQSQNWMISAKTGVALQGVNVEDFRRLPIPVPPIQEQREIVRRLDAALAQLEAAAEAHATAVVDLDRLEEAILGQAFRGALVDQNPADEHAGIVLDRLAATAALKAAQPKKRMPRKPKSSAAVEARALVVVLRESATGLSPEDLFRQSGRDEADLDQVEKFYSEIRQLVKKGDVSEHRPDSSTVLLKAIR